MKFKFLGYPDEIFPELVHGKVYDLIIEEYWNYRGIFSGNPAPRILIPIKCPYSSWEMFYQNWEKVNREK